MFAFNNFFIILEVNRMFTTLIHYEVIMDDTVIMVCLNRLRLGFHITIPLVNQNNMQYLGISAF